MAVEININLNGSANDNENTNDLKKASLPGNTNNNVAKKSGQKSQSMALLTMLGKSTINYAVQNVGRFTGDTTLQTNINNIKTASAFGIAAIKHPMLSIGLAGVQLGTTALNNYIEDKDNRQAAARAQARAGYTNNKVLGRRY